MVENLESGPAALPQWTFSLDLDNVGAPIASLCHDQISHVRMVLAQWKSNGRPWSIPLEWLPPRVENPEKNRVRVYRYNLMRRSAFASIFHHLEKEVVLSSSRDILAQHQDPTSLQPDFFLHVPRTQPPDCYECNLEDSLAADPLHSLPFVLRMTTYSGGRTDIEPAITGMLSASPGMVLRRQPSVDPQFSHESPDFALLLNRIARSPTTPTWFRADILHPALLIGQRDRKSDAHHMHTLHNLARIVQPHLDAHLENWRETWPPEEVDVSSDSGDSQCSLRNGEPSQPSYAAPTSPSTRQDSTCPPCMVLFGILYDGGREGHLTIVAHIPYAPAGQRLIDLDNKTTHYISCVVDRMALPGILGVPISGNVESPYLANFKAAMCLLVLKRHALIMANTWEKTVWPHHIVREIDKIEDQYLGPLRSVSDTSSEDEEPLTFRCGQDSDAESEVGYSG